MAPKRKPTDAAAAAGNRVTRRSARLANANTNANAAVADPKPPQKKKAKFTTPPPPPKVVEGSKTVVIEHCKQCNSFKTRAVQVKNGLEKGVEGVNVLVNPEKPRRGCFEIREEGGGVFVSLLDMKRPFKPMKDLDMEEVISEIVEKIR